MCVCVPLQETAGIIYRLRPHRSSNRCQWAEHQSVQWMKMVKPLLVVTRHGSESFSFTYTFVKWMRMITCTTLCSIPWVNTVWCCDYWGVTLFLLQETCGIDMVWHPVTPRVHHGSTSQITCAGCRWGLWTRYVEYVLNMTSWMSKIGNRKCIIAYKL